jgi:RNA recognition motif-containing protein
LSLGILFLPALQSIQRIEKMGTKLYVGNLSFRTTSEELREAFAAVGTVESASVIEDRDTGRSRGFAFVEMATPEEAAAAIEQFNGKDFGGRNLTVNEAKPRTDRGGRGGGYGGGRGGYGGGGDGGDRGGDRGGYEREPRW